MRAGYKAPPSRLLRLKIIIPLILCPNLCLRVAGWDFLRNGKRRLNLGKRGRG